MRRIVLAAAVVVLLAVGGAAALFVRSHEGRNVRGSSTEEFVTTEAPAPTRPPEPGIAWPMYGYAADHLRVGPGTHRPPFKRLWRFGARQLVEFPPAVAYGRLYFLNARGTLFAVNAKTGRRAWRRESGRCQASSPAVERHLVYVTYLRGCSPGHRRFKDGRLVAYDAGGGKVRWERKIGQSESSPVLHRGFVYVGDWTGRVYAFVAQTGRLAWSFKSGGKVKSSVAISGNRLFFGSYDHNVYALNLKTGKLIWKAGAQKRFGRHRGTFYSGPAVAYGRVYIGGTDGKVYSFGAASGKTRWVHGTGGWVYSSPAVWRKRVYAGSYSKKLYCLDAATGDVKWVFRANGKISGSPTVVGGLVWFATLAKRTYALDARTGRLVWSFPDGQYTPVVSDAERLYLIGQARVYGLESRSAVRARAQNGRRKQGRAASGPKAS
jgi:outer membrane protein assembly factor BamB